MTAGSTYAALRTQVGIAKEATKQTGVAPTNYLPLKTFNASPKVTQLTDEGWRGSMGNNYGMQNGTQYAELDLAGDVFADSIGWILAGVLGDVATTGASSPYTHKMALLNTGDGQPKSYTLTDNQGGIQARQYAGAQFSECTLKFDAAGLLNFDAKALSLVGSTAATPTATYTTTVPIPSWVGSVQIAGAAAANIESAEIAIKRDGAEALFAVGAADPYSLHVGGLSVTTKITFVAKDESPVVDYLAGTTKALLCSFSQGANASVALQMTQHHYDDAKVTRGKAYMEVETTGRAILNATDIGGSGGLSPLLATVVNALPTGTYA